MNYYYHYCAEVKEGLNRSPMTIDGIYKSFVRITTTEQYREIKRLICRNEFEISSVSIVNFSLLHTEDEFN